jgi:hypothetical protein
LKKIPWISGTKLRFADQFPQGKIHKKQENFINTAMFRIIPAFAELLIEIDEFYRL